MENKAYNPDVLNCLANLSNDEVFTPPALANQVLDMLPQHLFSNPTTTFLDPFCKSGVFLREIVKRLDRGLAEKMPHRQQRIHHIMHHQVFGIALTELTSLLSRRTLYCSKAANSQHSVCHFSDEQGHVWYKAISHTWVNGKCKYCGASKDVYDRGSEAEQYAYQFIHTDNPEKLFPKKMKFDVIIGNPPYQLSDGGGMGTSAIPLYNKFVEQAIRLKPRYLSMIIPARWYAGGKGLDDFRSMMLHDNRIRHLSDYFNAEDCFPGVDISGGVCYFLWDRDHQGECEVINYKNGNTVRLNRLLLEEGQDSFVRFNEAISILRKVKGKQFTSFESIVSARKPFGDIKNIKADSSPLDVLVYAYPKNGYVTKTSITVNQEWIRQYKVFIAKAYGERGDFPYLVLGKPFIGTPNTCCTETYLHIGPCKEVSEAESIISYMRTRFFRFFVLFKKNTQNAAKGVYSFVPLQDFSHPWTDEMLYEKYGLDENEIAFIESMIRPME